MRTTLDFVSKTTGRIHLKAAFDTAPDGLSRADARSLCKKLRRFQRELQRDLGLTHKIQLTIDNYDASVFWYLVLFRPILFRKDDPLFGSRTWNVHEVINSKHADSLGKTDLGVVYDQEQKRLVLIWPEAFDGVLSGIEECPSWKKIIKGKDKSTWKRYANSFSFTVPQWQLKRENFLQHFWQRQGHRIRYEDITAPADRSK